MSSVTGDKCKSLSHLTAFSLHSALRKVQNQLRHEVNRLQAENTKLHVSIDELETQVNEYVCRACGSGSFVIPASF